jgi:hypothetical protein
MASFKSGLKSLLQRVDQLIEHEYVLPQGALSLFRIIYASFVLFIIGVPRFRWIAERPDFFFDPPSFSLAGFFSGFPGYFFFLSIDMLLVILFVMLLFGLYTRLVTMGIGLLMVVGFSFYYSFGKINHDAFLMIYVPFAMVFSNWNRYFSLDRQRKSFSAHQAEKHWPVLLLAILLGFAMFSAGVPKLLDGWLNINTQAVKGFVVNFNYYDTSPERFLQPYLIGLDFPLFWEMMDYTAVLFEVLFLLAVIRRRLFMAFVVMAVTFHTMNILFFSISFVNNLALYLLFIEWKPVLSKFNRLPIKRYLKKTVFWPVMAIVAACYLLEMPLTYQSFTEWLGIPFLTSSLILSLLANTFFVYHFSTTLNLGSEQSANQATPESAYLPDR